MKKKLLSYLGIPFVSLIALTSFNMVEFKDGTMTIYFTPQNSLNKKEISVEENKEEEKENKNKEEKESEESRLNNLPRETPTVSSSEEKYITVSFEHYELEFNCERGGYNHFSYNTVPDSGKLERYAKFLGYKEIGNLCGYDDETYKRSQRTSTYKSPKGASTYDRGHGVHQNIWDHNKELMKQTNYMINISPHESKQNRQGLWRYGEKLTECLRDQNELYVIGGNIWGNDTSNDHFVKSHNVQTPDELFKIIVNGNNVHAWIMPNNGKANARNANNYSVSIHDIEQALGYTFSGINENLRHKKGTTPSLPKNCSLQ